MSSRQLILDLLSGKNIKRVGLRETFWPETLSAWVDQGYPTRMVFKQAGEKRWNRADGRWVEADEGGEYEEPAPPHQHFGFDLGEIDFGINHEPILGYREVLEETDEWETFRNGAGGVMKYWKHRSGTPEHIDFSMTTREVWERDYRHHLLELDPRRIEAREIAPRLEQMKEAGRFSTHNHGFVWEWMRFCMGDLAFYPTLLQDPGWARDFCRVYTDFYKVHYAYLFETIGVFDGVWVCDDLAYGNGPFASPKLIQELILPFYSELVDFYHGHGVAALFHSDGAVARVLPLVAEAGFDAFNPVEAKAKGNDIFQFAEQYGDRLAFVGGLDARVLETNDKDTIGRAVGEFIDGLKERGARFVFASDHSVSPLVRYDSYRYALDVYHEHKMY